jgi:hypothetical protein
MAQSSGTKSSLGPGSGTAIERVQAYNIATGETTTVAQDADETKSDIWSPSIAGSLVAWAFRASDSAPFELRLKDMQSGESQAITAPGGIVSCGLTADGRYLAWDGPDGRYVQELATGKRTEYGDDGSFGAASMVDGDFVSSQPIGHGGSVYDARTGILRVVYPQDQAMTNIAQALGPWFVWMVHPYDASDPGYYYLAPLPQ